MDDSSDHKEAQIYSQLPGHQGALGMSIFWGICANSAILGHVSDCFTYTCSTKLFLRDLSSSP